MIFFEVLFNKHLSFPGMVLGPGPTIRDALGRFDFGRISTLLFEIDSPVYATPGSREFAVAQVT